MNTQAAREWVRPTTEAAELTAAEIERIKASMPDIPYPVDLQSKRRYAFVAQVKNGGRAQVVYVDGSDTSMVTQLEDSGYGSAGIM